MKCKWNQILLRSPTNPNHPRDVSYWIATLTAFSTLNIVIALSNLCDLYRLTRRFVIARYARQRYTQKHEKLGLCLSLTVNSTIRVYLVAETNAAPEREWKAAQCPSSGGSSEVCSLPCASIIYMQVPQK